MYFFAGYNMPITFCRIVFKSFQRYQNIALQSDDNFIVCKTFACQTLLRLLVICDPSKPQASHRRSYKWSTIKVCRV